LKFTFKDRKTMKKIKELLPSDMKDTFKRVDGHEMLIVTEATSSNMGVLMDKINELVNVINKLKK